MGTVIITTAGFSTYPATAPTGWPVNVKWPPTGSPVFNNAHTATLTDAELLQMITWVASSQYTSLFQAQTPPVTVPISITTAQLHNVWVQTFFSGIKSAIQQYFTTPAVVPPPINLN